MPNVYAYTNYSLTNKGKTVKLIAPVHFVKENDFSKTEKPKKTHTNNEIMIFL